MRALGLWWVVVFLCACGDTAPAVSGLVSIVPNHGNGQISVPVRIYGTHFDVAVDSRYDAVQTSIDARFYVALGQMEMRDVIRRSGEELSATLPLGLMPGVYTLTVRTPTGEQLSLPAAFSIVDD